MKREVMIARNTPEVGCCEQHANREACTCLDDAIFVLGDEVHKINGFVVSVFFERVGPV